MSQSSQRGVQCRIARNTDASSLCTPSLVCYTSAITDHHAMSIHRTANEIHIHELRGMVRTKILGETHTYTQKHIT